MRPYELVSSPPACWGLDWMRNGNSYCDPPSRLLLLGPLTYRNSDPVSHNLFPIGTNPYPEVPTRKTRRRVNLSTVMRARLVEGTMHQKKARPLCLVLTPARAQSLGRGREIGFFKARFQGRNKAPGTGERMESLGEPHTTLGTVSALAPTDRDGT
jgi:hypothetical protein